MVRDVDGMSVQRPASSPRGALVGDLRCPSACRFGVVKPFSGRSSNASTSPVSAVFASRYVTGRKAKLVKSSPTSEQGSFDRPRFVSRRVGAVADRWSRRDAGINDQIAEQNGASIMTQPSRPVGVEANRWSSGRSTPERWKHRGRSPMA